jgi:diguanylate cyclase (GGDEF)-like protein
VPVEPVLAIATVAVLANLVVLVVIVVPILFGRRSPLAPTERPGDVALLYAVEVARDGTVVEHRAGAYDRVVLVVSWAYLLVTTLIVAATGLWVASQEVIFGLLGVAAVFVLVVHVLLPVSVLGGGKYVLEGSMAITFATLLVALTGGAASPFFITFPLLVGAAALVVSTPVTVALTAVAAFAYLLAVAGGAPDGLLGQDTLAPVGINLTALFLLAYAGSMIAREQRGARDAAIRLSTIDPLSGLYNRAYFFAALDAEIARSARSGRGFCLVMADLDELKTINDRFGHFHGDRVLRGVGDVVRAGVRRIDTAARYGGDEFVILLPETDPTGAFVLAEKIRIGVAGLEIGLPSPVVRPSLSVGVVSYPHDGRTADELMISADEAMYHSKRAGKNRVTGVRMSVTAPSGHG